MRLRTSLVFVSVVLGCLGCDHATKQIARELLPGVGGVGLAGDTLRLELASNPGGFLSLGAGMSEELRLLLFLAAVPLLVAVLCVKLLRAQRPTAPLLVAVGLLAGGGLSNWLDRLLHGGAVTDFVSLGWGPLRTGIFNLADLAVVTGVALLIWRIRERPAPQT
jgi:signal peptidase II